MQLPNEVISEDRRLTAEGERVNASLGELRYEWCVTQGLAYTAYASSVGCAESSVRQSVTDYAAKRNLPVARHDAKPNPKGGRPRKAEPATRSKPTESVERLPVPQRTDTCEASVCVGSSIPDDMPERPPLQRLRILRNEILAISRDLAANGYLHPDDRFEAGKLLVRSAEILNTSAAAVRQSTEGQISEAQ